MPKSTYIVTEFDLARATVALQRCQTIPGDVRDNSRDAHKLANKLAKAAKDTVFYIHRVQCMAIYPKGGVP